MITGRYFITVEGDIKHYAEQVPMTISAEYERETNTTHIVVQAGEVNHSPAIRKLYMRLHNDIKEHEIRVRYEKESKS